MRRSIPLMIVCSMLLLQGCYTIVNAPPDSDDMVIKSVPTTQDFFLGNSYMVGVTGWDPWWEPSYSPYGFDSYYSYLNPFDYYNGSYAAGFPYSRSYQNGYYGRPGYTPSWGLGRVSDLDSIGVSRDISRDEILGAGRSNSRTPINNLIQQQQIIAAANPSLNAGSLERAEKNPNRIPLHRKYRNEINFNLTTPAQTAPSSTPVSSVTTSSQVAKPNPTSTPSVGSAKPAPMPADRDEETRSRQREHAPSDNSSRK